MTCPDCQGPLRQEDVDGVAIDRCPDCGGIWFDAGELQRAGAPYRGTAGSRLGRFVPTNVPAGPCPRCSGSTLNAGLIDGRPVSRCASCLGVWVALPLPEPKKRDVPTDISPLISPDSPFVQVGKAVLDALELALIVFRTFV